VIVELEFIHYRPRAGEIVSKAYSAAIDEGHGPAPLLGYWTVDVGPLNSAVLLWLYEDHEHLDDARAKSGERGWPPALENIVTSTESMLLRPASFNDALTAGEFGAIYEIRIYDYASGSVGTVEERWADMVDVRRAISPLIGCFSSSDGPVDKWVHIWAYEDGRARDGARSAAARGGIWPPETGEWLLHQENMIVVPSAFCALH
jgi:hypothetical protein